MAPLPTAATVALSPAPSVTTTTLEPQPGAVEDGALRSGTGAEGHGEGRCPQWRETALAAGWSEAEWPTLSRIIYAESGCDPSAHNLNVVGDYGRAAGLAQVMDGLWPSQCGITPDQLFDPFLNLSCALLIYRLQSWDAWATY